MVNKILNWLSHSLLHKSSPARLALASAIGFFLGMLPLDETRLILILLISLVFSLNIIPLLLGAAIAVVGYQIPFFSMHYFSFSLLKELAFKRHYLLLVNIIIGIVLALISFPLFKFFYSWGLNENKSQVSKRSIFYDYSGKRWLFLKRFGLIILAVSFVVISMFAVSLNINPLIPRLGLKSINKFHNINPVFGKYSENYLTAQLRDEEKRHPTFQLDFKKHYVKKHVKQFNKGEVYGFFVNWDENSTVSLKRNIKSLNVLVPEWYHLNADMTLNAEVQKNIDELAESRNVKVIPLINNFINGKWDKDIVHNILITPAARTKVINELYQQVKGNGFAGINIDFEQIDVQDQDGLTAFMKQLYLLFHANGLEVTMDVPADDTAFDYGALSNNVDRMIVMLYDEHDQNGIPGPIASANWYQQSLEQMDIPPQKLIVSLGNYGYDWALNSKAPADAMTFGDITDLVNNANLKIEWDDKSKNPYVRYKDGAEQHIVWFLDGATIFNQMKIAEDNGVAGVAMWRLGSEDPTVWDALKNKSGLDQHVHDLEALKSADPTHYSGGGEILRITSSAEDGKRSIQLDNNGLIANETYVVLPKPFEIERFGKPKGKEVVLTFDDGPDPDYTPRILDILAKNKIRAAFFVVGENAELYPDLIARIYREGHEIGNHTFTHPNVAAVSPIRTKMELNANQRLIQEITGHSMTMFRPPYVADAEPSTPSELLPILRAQEMGYTMIGELIDPEDWQKPSSDEIVRRVLDQLSYGNIILLHDAGGDRTNTVKALPKIIKALRSRGYSFVTIEDLLGKKRNDLMPPVQSMETPFMDYDRVVFTGVSDWQHTIADLFYLAIGLGIFRFIFLIYFASKQRKKYKNKFGKKYKPFVSVVIAAYNEEKVICKTINSILESDYSGLEVIVIDDGSKDNTSGVVNENFNNDTRVRVITKANGGKSSAVNVGFKEAKGEIVVALDADTVIARNAISLLVRHFLDENIAAVSGNVKVGNVHNLLTLWQHVEYVTGFNLERRAFDELNCITVVPGAIGAWRKEAVRKAGYFKEDTLAEDTDITLTLLQQGYQIAYEEQAYAFTESPGDVKSLVKQRFRWSYGTLQCLWKHRNALFNKKHKTLGFIALPSMWLFQYIFQSISPLADIVFAMGLFGPNPGKVLVYYVTFLIIDLLASMYAFRLDGESPKPLVWLFLQRLVYRQLMTYVILKSLVSALRGGAVGWNKLQRRGNVQSPQGN